MKSITILVGIIAAELAVLLYVAFWFVGYVTEKDRGNR